MRNRSKIYANYLKLAAHIPSRKCLEIVELSGHFLWTLATVYFYNFKIPKITTLRKQVLLMSSGKTEHK